MIRTRLLLTVILLTFLTRYGSSQVSVLTQHNDNARSGANLAETKLTPANVNVNQFGKLFSRTVDGQIYAQPLYVPQVEIPEQGYHNVIYVATQHNSIYAFDADDPEATAPLWHVNLGPSAPTPTRDFGTRFGRFTNIIPEIGITSTPVIDPVSQTLYAVAFTKDPEAGGYRYRYRLHALDITTGKSKPPGPVIIQGKVRGTGAGSVKGTITFDAQQHLQRPSLLLSQGIIYIACAGFADTPPYHGWVFAYDAQTLKQKGIFCTTPNGQDGGIWQSGQGPAADEKGNVYVATSNGSFNGGSDGSSPGGRDFGDSLLKLRLRRTGLVIHDWFAPYNRAFLTQYDEDFGNCGPMLIPGTNYLVQAGKYGGFVYVFDQNKLGRFVPGGGDSQIVQRFRAASGALYGSAVAWNGPRGMCIYLWGVGDYLKAFKLDGDRFQTTPVSRSIMQAPPASIPGGILSLSADGKRNGIVWATHPLIHTAVGRTVAGIVRAFDATDLTKELWNSKKNAPRDDIGNFAKFCPPTVADGKLFVPTFSNQLMVYGILPAAPVPAVPTSLKASPGPRQVLLTWDAVPGASSYRVKRLKQPGSTQSKDKNGGVKSNPAGASPTYITIARNVSGTSYIDKSLTNGQSYSYVISALSSGGESGDSTSVSTIPRSTFQGHIISLNFLGEGLNGTPALLGGGEAAGANLTAHWNNASSKSGKLGNLKDNWGAITGTTVTWSAFTASSSSLPETPGHNRMMKGYLNTDGRATTTVKVSNLPRSFIDSGYDVYVYCNYLNATGFPDRGIYQIGDTKLFGVNLPDSLFSGRFTLSTSATGTENTNSATPNDSGNYVLFSNLKDGSFELAATPDALQNTLSRAPINGIQIVARQHS